MNGDNPGDAALVVTSLDDTGKVEGYQVDQHKQKKIMDILRKSKPIAGKIVPSLVSTPEATTTSVPVNVYDTETISWSFLCTH